MSGARFDSRSYTEKSCGSQDAALDATADSRIKAVRTDTHYDVAWELEDGRIVALTISTGGGCPTCGYGSGEQEWFVLTPKVTP